MGMMGVMGGASRGFLFCYRPSSADNPTAVPLKGWPATGAGHRYPAPGTRGAVHTSIYHPQFFAAFFGEGGLFAFQLYGHCG